jgi:hypothetical protein
MEENRRMANFLKDAFREMKESAK